MRIFVSNVRQLISADDYSRRYVQMQFSWRGKRVEDFIALNMQALATLLIRSISTFEMRACV